MMDIEGSLANWDIVIKKRKRPLQSVAVDPCLGFYKTHLSNTAPAPPVTTTQAFNEPRQRAIAYATTSSPHIQVLGSDPILGSATNIHPGQIYMSSKNVSPASHSKPPNVVSKSSPTITVDAFLRTSVLKQNKRYRGRRTRMHPIVDLRDLASNKEKQKESQECQSDHIERPGKRRRLSGESGSGRDSDRALNRSRSSGNKKEAKKRKSRTRRPKSLAQRMLEAVVLSHVDLPSPRAAEGSFTRRPLNFVSEPASRTPPPARNLYRKRRTIVEPGKSQLLQGSTFPTSDVLRESHPARSKCRPLTHWRVKPYDIPDGQAPKTKTVSKKAQVHPTSDRFPLTFVTIQNHEQACASRYTMNESDGGCLGSKVKSGTQRQPLPFLAFSATIDAHIPREDDDSWTALDMSTSQEAVLSALDSSQVDKALPHTPQVVPSISPSVDESLPMLSPPAKLDLSGLDTVVDSVEVIRSSEDAAPFSSNARAIDSLTTRSVENLPVELCTTSPDGSFVIISSPAHDSLNKRPPSCFNQGFKEHESASFITKPLKPLASFFDEFIETARTATETMTTMESRKTKRKRPGRASSSAVSRPTVVDVPSETTFENEMVSGPSRQASLAIPPSHFQLSLGSPAVSTRKYNVSTSTRSRLGTHHESSGTPSTYASRPSFDLVAALRVQDPKEIALPPIPDRANPTDLSPDGADVLFCDIFQAPMSIGSSIDLFAGLNPGL